MDKRHTSTGHFVSSFEKSVTAFLLLGCIVILF